ncbi:RDD family protein [Arenibacter sp. GZD96]|uniref:RDD family protein n=1 Tax=Aurantibrevibacter litoralis TaxID=3106030 RepID=UPI002AFDEA99|nr:RDD family protein [Arenibacter sp. GZD-96]MEA1784882.1 RDD family protein [Arenibacter sp. GZD-96]
MNETEYKGVLRKEVNKLAGINPRFHRISSMLLDHIIMTIVIVPTLILLMILATNGILEIGNGTFSVVFFFMMFIYINKDFFNAKSPAKRILGYQVINRKTEKPASELQCFVRNLTIAVAWPLEVIFGLINPERRIGDFLANTKVVVSEKEKLKTIWTDLKSKNLKLNLIGILIIGVIYFYGLSLIMPNMN